MLRSSIRRFKLSTLNAGRTTTGAAALPLVSVLDSNIASSMSSMPRGRRFSHLPGTYICTVLVAAALFLVFNAFNRTSTSLSIFDRHPDVAAARTHEYVSTTRLSQHLFPEAQWDKESPWDNLNSKTLRALFVCLEKNSCLPNQEKVILVGSFHFLGALKGWNGGEDVWARSTIQALTSQNYTILYTTNMDRLHVFYSMFPERVHIAIVEASQAVACVASDECAKRPGNPNGIPLWKLLSFHFWPSAAGPLGARWTLSPEDYGALPLSAPAPGPESDAFSSAWAGNTYGGYSIESSCASAAFVPPASLARTAYILARKPEYVTQSVWDVDELEEAGAAAGVRFVLGLDSGGPHPADVPLPTGATDLGWLSGEKFVQTIAGVRVLIGIGLPTTSPTPYEALCLGVPFINPVLTWDHADPENRAKWDSQHPPLAQLDPPYVYNVRISDRAGFVAAVKAAVDTPIESFVPERMRMPAIEARWKALAERDWRAEAAALLEHRRRTGDGPLFEL